MIPTDPLPSKSGGPPGFEPQATSRSSRSPIPIRPSPSRSQGQEEPSGARTGTVTAAWSGLTAGTKYLGRIVYSDGSATIGSTLVGVEP